MIRAIIFDCFGVLTTDRWRAFVDTLSIGADRTTAEDIHRAYEAGLLPKKDAASKIQQATGKTYTEIEDVFAGEVAKNRPLLNYIRTLKGKYKLGLMSNVASNWIRESFLDEEEQALFDEMILSFEVGITKPDPRIFMLACERLRVGPHEAILIDDNPKFCEAAETEGLQAIIYSDFMQLKSELELKIHQE